MARHTYTCTHPYGTVLADRRVGPDNQVTPADPERKIPEGSTVDLRHGDVLVTTKPFDPPHPHLGAETPPAKAAPAAASSPPAALPSATN